MSEQRLKVWVRAIRQYPHLYRLPKYGLWSIDKAAELFARWAADQLAGNDTALCRRCGRVLAERYIPSQQLHVTCAPPWWPYPAPPKTVGITCNDDQAPREDAS